ncbi:hypothetical protein EEA47_02735 [Vibrio alginolyticus]|nr:hypothetical protein EEA47_02735 [Vibrio alginolyticus]
MCFTFNKAFKSDSQRLAVSLRSSIAKRRSHLNAALTGFTYCIFNLIIITLLCILFGKFPMGTTVSPSTCFRGSFQQCNPLLTGAKGQIFVNQMVTYFYLG